MIVSKRAALMCAVLLFGFSTALQPDIITLPLRKTKVSKPMPPRHADPSWENKLFSALEGLRDTLVLGSTPDLDTDIINDENWKYEATIYVGSDKQAFNVHMDTGSNKLIMLSTATEVSSNYCDYPARFDTSTSSTFVNTGIGDSISYLDGSYIRGVVARDTVSLDTARTYKATSFQFLLATSQSGFECDDGLIGMTRMSAGQAYP